MAGVPASHEYEYSGDHEVTLNVTDDRGLSSEVTQIVWISNALYQTYIDIYVDSEYLAVYGGSTWFEQAEYMISLVNDVYVPQVGLTYAITGMMLDGSQTSYDMPASFHQFETSFGVTKELVPPTRWAAFLSGKDFEGTDDYFGTPRACLIGLSESPPKAGYSPDFVFSFIQQRNDACHAQRPINAAERAYAIKHELGHNHNGDHPFADDYACIALGQPSWCRTIMYGPFWLSFVDAFSDGDRNINHNNAARIRGWIVANGA